MLVLGEFRASVNRAIAGVAVLPDESVDCVVGFPSVGVAAERFVVAELRRLWAEVRRVLRPAGVSWLVLQDRAGASAGVRGMPWLVAFGLQRDGWWLRNAVVVGDHGDAGYSTAFLLTRQRRYGFDLAAARNVAGRNSGDVWYCDVPDALERCTAVVAGAGPVVRLFGAAGEERLAA